MAVSLARRSPRPALCRCFRGLVALCNDEPDPASVSFSTHSDRRCVLRPTHCRMPLFAYDRASLKLGRIRKSPWAGNTRASSRRSATRRWCRINRLAPAGVNLYVKIEAFNPLGSVKDRLALGVIEAAEKSGRAEARPDGDRGDQRQHRHRPRHGVRGQGLSAGRDHGRDSSASSAAG